MSSTYGNKIKISIFGQSHSEAIGVTIDGLPAGIHIDMDKLQKFMNRRAPGGKFYSTPRKEEDKPHFVSGLVNDITCGAPITALIYNTNTISKDYDNLRDIPRPSHADYTAQIKYKGFQDVAGGGHFSGRLTAPLCIAGNICMQYLEQRGIKIAAHIAKIGGIEDDKFDMVNVSKEDLDKLLSYEFPIINQDKFEEMKQRIEEVKKDLNSVGGVVECAATGIPAGIGDPIFDGMENRIASIMFGIPAVKGIEFGNGFEASDLTGKENNDEFRMDGDKVVTKTNNHGGILGGITSGMPLVFKVAFKPTPSIASEQKSVSLKNRMDTDLVIKGRHDPCIVPRAVPVVEAAAAIAICDAML